MHFESFSNELFLEIFEFLTTSSIYHAFHDLNTRMNAVILEYFRSCKIDFRSISKFDFDIISQHYLPQTIDRITSLCLSDDDDTPGQIDQFFSHGFILRQFISLQSLFLCNIRSEQIMDKLMFDLPYLSNLTDLTFEQCYLPLQNDRNKAISFANFIWSLPKLVHCCFKVNYKYRQSHHFVNKYRRDNGILVMPTVTSTTLECLSFVGLERCNIAMDQLFTHTPRLRRLVIDKYSCIDTNPSTTSLSVTTFIITLSDYQYQRHLLNFLQKMPNLRRLKVDVSSTYSSPSSYEWEALIRNYLPKLERLQFKMVQPMYDGITKENINSTLRSFKSQFWLVEHRWFVQCDWNSDKNFVNIYTLPYAFDNFRCSVPILSASTSPYDNNQYSYDCVRNLMYKPRIFNMSSPSYIQFFNIQHLSIEFPISTHFSSLVPKLDRLISLDALSENHDELCQRQLQDLLNRAPRLTSIRISWKNLTSPLRQIFNGQNLSVHHLELLWYGRSFNREQCRMLSNLIPGIQCKVLNLVVANRTCILALINTLNHLRVLNVQFQNDKTNRQLEPITDDLCEWLQQQLSSTSFNTKISRQDGLIRLWIR